MFELGTDYKGSEQWATVPVFPSADSLKDLSDITSARTSYFLH